MCCVSGKELPMSGEQEAGKGAERVWRLGVAGIPSVTVAHWTTVCLRFSP